MFTAIVLEEPVLTHRITPQRLLKDIREYSKYVFQIELQNNYLQDQMLLVKRHQEHLD